MSDYQILEFVYIYIYIYIYYRFNLKMNNLNRNTLTGVKRCNVTCHIYIYIIKIVIDGICTIHQPAMKVDDARFFRYNL